uniref:Transmembrane protein 126A n=1 Tax=Dromaius novaehollandiae TaxID=8790 RepID=A0A8C4P5I1_DRONO
GPSHTGGKEQNTFILRITVSDAALCKLCWASYFLAGNSSLCGLAANNFFRRTLNITKAPFISALPMAVIPFLSTAAVYEAFLRRPLFLGDLNCEVCAVVRGGLIGAVVGGLYPFLLALPVNASLAARYSSAPLPGKENLLRFWHRASQPVFKKMSFGILIQTTTNYFKLNFL